MRVKSTFSYQDTDVIPLADKCIVVRSFICRNCDKVLMKMRMFSDKIRVKEKGQSVVDRVLKSSNSTFQNNSNRLNPLGKSVVEVDILFLSPPSGILFTRVYD